MSSKTPKGPKDSAAKVQPHLDSLRDMGKRFVNAWKRAEKGEPVNKGEVLSSKKSKP